MKTLKTKSKRVLNALKIKGKVSKFKVVKAFAMISPSYSFYPYEAKRLSSDEGVQ